jgi:hypothetical protein
MKAGERQACLLDVRAADAAIEAVLAGQQLERKARRT